MNKRNKTTGRFTKRSWIDRKVDRLSAWIFVLLVITSVMTMLNLRTIRQQNADILSQNSSPNCEQMGYKYTGTAHFSNKSDEKLSKMIINCVKGE